MSGPKGINPVLAERLRRERELEARRRTWQAIAGQLETLARRCRTAQIECDVWRELGSAGYERGNLGHPSEADLDAIARLEQARDQIVRRVNEVESERAAGRAQEALAALRSELDAAGPLVVTALTAASTKRGDRTHADTVQLLTGLLGSTGERRQDLTSELENLVENGHRTDRQAWLVLAGHIADAVRQERDRHAQLRLRDELAALVARVEGPVATSLLARIDAAPDRASLESLRPKVIEDVRAAERESERAFVIEQAAEVWRELGYEPGPEFTEVAISGAALLLSRRGWSQHALQVRFDRGGLGIATNVIATGDSSPVRDAEIEKGHCVDIGSFTSRLTARGIDAAVVRSTPAGALPMQRLNGDEVKARRRRRAAARKVGS